MPSFLIFHAIKIRMMLASDFLLFKPGKEQKDCLLWYLSCLSQQWSNGEQDSTVIYLFIQRGCFKSVPITKNLL